MMPYAALGGGYTTETQPILRDVLQEVGTDLPFQVDMISGPKTSPFRPLRSHRSRHYRIPVRTLVGDNSSRIIAISSPCHKVAGGLFRIGDRALEVDRQRMDDTCGYLSGPGQLQSPDQGSPEHQTVRSRSTECCAGRHSFYVELASEKEKQSRNSKRLSLGRLLDFTRVSLSTSHSVTSQHGQSTAS